MIVILLIILLAVYFGMHKLKDKKRFSYSTREIFGGIGAGVMMLFIVTLVITIITVIAISANIITNRERVIGKQAVIVHINKQIKTGLVEKYYGKRERLKEIRCLESARSNIRSSKKIIKWLTFYRY